MVCRVVFSVCEPNAILDMKNYVFSFVKSGA